MHPIRRRKKRSNYGVRTVEVVRGKNGFGFTISGQQPCILSCIVSGSPAEKAGLRPGDYLVAVNGQSVSKLPHDDVVRLIGCLNGVLKLQIAENYYSDSSDEDNITSVRSKPKFIHKPRNVDTNQRSNGFQTNRTSKLIRDQRFSGTNKFDVNCALPLKSSFDGSWELPELPPPRILHVCNSASNSKEDLSFVIGYLGTIEMPKQIQPGYRLQVVRGCIKKLRTEKRSHAWVLMRVHADGITVAGNGGKILAEYPISRIIYCGTSSDEDKKYFGLVTTGTGDGNEVLPSSSCHVFAVQSNLFEHQKHFAKASAFKIKCTTGTLSQGCFEFPSTSEPILNAIKLFCLTKVEGNIYLNPNELLVANSPQPSHSGSTAASSNSDSGIGFRDECGNQSDRIVMVDVENQRLHIQQLYNSQNLENCQNYLNIQLQPSATEDSQNLQNAFVSDNALCNLPDIMDSKYDARSPDHCTDKSDSKAATSNRSRSPLISSSTSSDDEKSIAKLVCQKNILKNRSTHLTSSKSFEVEASAKSLTDVWYEKSIFYQLGLLPYQTFLGVKPKDMQDVNYKVTSKSSENLDSTVHCHHKVESEECNLAFNKCNSKSIDNLTHKTNSVDLHAKNYLRSPQADIANCTSQMMGSPLSISYGEGSLLQFNGEHKTRVAENDKSLGCDKLDSLPSCCMISSSNFSKDSNNREDATRSKFKSVDNMSVCSYKSNDALLSYKLSPKVFGMKRPLVTQSLEDLKVSETIGNVINYPLSSSVKQQWGSLQDLRSLASVSYDMSLAPEAEDFIEKEASDENGGVVSWGNSLEKLLEDATGVAAFAEFLKKEFSQENITFWVSCERYKALSDESERKKLATEIFETHLGIRAMEPVNIDAHAHQHTLDKLSEAPVDLFVPAQKQIFNLMKFDSYPRFIKSDLYKECLLRELRVDEDIPYSGDIQLASTLQKSIESTPNRGKLKKSRSDAEDSNRKSLLPWHKKNRSKSKDRGEYEYKLSTLAQKRDTEDVVSVRSEITSSRSSLASWDLALRGSFSRQSITSGEISERENCQLCRVILSDGATTVVRVRPKETIQELICRLLEKRGLHYSSFESFIAGSSKPLDLNEDASTLSNKEIHVEQRIVFKLDLPNRRTISVKSKTTKNLGQVLRSVLHKYSYRLEAIAICSVSDNEVLELSLPITAVDGKKLTVLTRSTDTWRNTDSTQGSNVTSNKKFVKPGPTLDEITNKVFEEVLQGKADVALKSDQGSLKSEEWGSEHSSGIFSKFLRRDSTFHDKAKAKSRGATSRLILEGATKHMEGVVSMVTGKPPLIGKWKSSGKLGGKSDSDELYEGLKRAQRNRLEDQRGTEINFELPDFLKDKENTPQSGKKVRKFTREDGTATPKFFDMEPTEDTQPQISQMSAKNTLRNEKNHNNVKSPESSKLNLSTASAKKMDCIGRTISKPLTCKTYETPRTTPIKNDFAPDNGKRSSLFESSERVLSPSKCEPPPLPPKPKYLPSKSIPLNLNHLTNAAPEQITSRGTNILKPSDIKRDNKLARSRRTMYLDHQSSSFV